MNLLPLFVAVAETESISAAARALGLPKSSISRGVSALEKSLGVQLFHRSTRRVVLSNAGRGFFYKAKPLSLSLQDLTAGFGENKNEPAGELRLSAPMDIALAWLNDAAADFMRRYPAVRIELRPSNQFVDLAKEGFDAALRVAGKLTDSALMVRKLSDLEMGMYAARTYLAAHGEPRTLDDLGSHDWVLLPHQKVPGPVRGGAKPRMVTDDIMCAYGAIRNGVGIGIIPSFLAQSDVLAGHVTRVLPRWKGAVRHLFFVHPFGRQAPLKVTALRDFVIEYLALHPLVT